MNLLGLEKNLGRLAKVNGMRCYGHVLRRDNDAMFRRASDFEVVGGKIKA